MAQLVGRKLVGRLSLHTDRDSGVALKRKRIQPVGSKECPGCGRTISANKDHCFPCDQQIGRTPNAGMVIDSAAALDAVLSAHPELKGRDPLSWSKEEWHMALGVTA